MRHPSLYAYTQHKCRCEPCVTHHYRHQKRYTVDRAAGRAHLVDAQPLRDHVALLTAAGMSQWDITIAAGWKSRNALACALKADRVTPKTMSRVMAITTPPVTRRNGYVDATGSRRRLQALSVMGYTFRNIAHRLGNLDQSTYVYIANGETATIRRRTAQSIAELYDELWDKPGASKRSTCIALRKGYAPPLAWDDDTIDDPGARPTGIAGKRVSSKRRAEMVEDFIDTLGTHGGDTYAAAERLCIPVDTLERALYRAKADGVDVTFARGRVVA